jgi:hypothetical protein
VRCRAGTRRLPGRSGDLPVTTLSRAGDVHRLAVLRHGAAGNRDPLLRQLVNEVIVGTKKPKEALDEAAGKVKSIMEKNGFYKGADPMNFAATEPGLWIGKGKPLPF